MRANLISAEQVQNAKLVYFAIRKMFNNHNDAAKFIGLSRGVASKLIYENKCSDITRKKLVDAFGRRSSAVIAADRANSCKSMARTISTILGA